MFNYMGINILNFSILWNIIRPLQRPFFLDYVRGQRNIAKNVKRDKISRFVSKMIINKQKKIYAFGIL